MSQRQKNPTEAELNTFKGWLLHIQDIDPAHFARLSKPEKAMWRSAFKEGRAKRAATRPVGLMNLARPGHRLYAVAIRGKSQLWLALFVRRTPKGEFFVCRPQNDHAWDSHTSYHQDGTIHSKSYKTKFFPKKVQKPDANFKGVVALGINSGFGESVPGAICDPKIFDGIVVVRSGVLGSRWGAVSVDVVQPGHRPLPTGRKTYKRRYFRDAFPNLAITVLR